MSWTVRAELESVATDFVYCARLGVRVVSVQPTTEPGVEVGVHRFEPWDAASDAGPIRLPGPVPSAEERHRVGCRGVRASALSARSGPDSDALDRP
jgi:hypothetical protein